MNRPSLRVATLAAFVLFVAAPSWAQQRPLTTEDPEPVGAGRVLLEFGMDYERDVFVPWSGLRGNVFTIPPMGISVGVSSIAEIQFDGGVYQRMSITERTPAPFSSILDIPPDATTTADVDDLHVGAKIKFLNEGAGRPSMALRFATRLPNAGNESGLGKDVQDFMVGVLVAKTVQSVRVVANVGMLIMGDPVQPARQDDLLTYNLSVARAVSPRTEVVGEFVGRANFADIITPGAEDRGLLRFGARYTTGSLRLDTGVSIGVTPRDPEFGFTWGFTWVFDAFKVP